MLTLDRLLFADLRRMWGQALAICMVLACGVATFVLSQSTVLSLDVSNERYYREYRFADVFLHLKRAPNRLAEQLKAIPGVKKVETRVAHQVILDIPTMVEPASCRLLSLPDQRGRELNAVHLIRGRYPDPNRRGEVLVSELFANAHRLLPGHAVKVIMGGRRETLRIVGIAISPEYILAIQPGTLVPDNRRFGIFWMPYRQMAAAFNMEGAFNDASFQLHADAQTSEVLRRIDNIAEAYGGLGAYTRNDQTSHRRIADEIHQLRGMAYVTPIIFLAVAAFLFNLVLTRLVFHQQEQIATLRAFGFTSVEIGLHYLKLMLLLVFGGLVLGSVAGVLLSRLMIDMYSKFFRFPAMYDVIDWWQIGVAALLSTGAAVIGGFAAVRRAMRLPPAIAMRPEAPSADRPSLAERLAPEGWIPPIAKMVFRRLERNSRSTIMSILGMALGVAVLVLGTAMEDAINYVMEIQFQRSQRQDVTLTFNEALSARSLHDALHLPGVSAAEPFRAATIQISHGRSTRKVSLMGLVEHPSLFRILDSREQVVPISPGGLTISEKLAEILGVQVGDDVQVAFLEGRKLKRQMRIINVFRDFTQPGAYANHRDLHQLLNEGESLSGAFLAVDSRQTGNLYRQVKDTPAIAGITLKQAAIDNFEDLVVENLRPMRTTNAIFASIIAFGVIYNCALITLTERSRDLATLRVLGFSRFEVSSVLLGELGVITLASLPIGLPVGYGLCYIAMLALDTETNRFPVVVSNATYAYAASLILTAAAVSAAIVRRMIDQLDLIAVLKVKE